MTTDARKHPVYVLGAGFSRAISEKMPLTDDLGDAVRGKMGHRLPHMDSGSSFEDWLTLLTTPLPFLDGFANTARRSTAEEVTATIAAELERRADEATASPPPLWLLQLVALWHAEEAVVLTFNYDLLVERAVSAVLPCLGSEGFTTVDLPKVLRGPQIVYPAPNASASSALNGLAQPTDRSMRLLKLHGSLDWYWAQGDGSTLTRELDRGVLGEAITPSRQDFAGVRTLDRFLIPPVTSKDSYYNVSLAHILWRTAHDALLDAESVTLIGYSIPPGDRITSEFLRLTPRGTPVDIVDFAAGNVSDPKTLAGRAQSRIGLAVRDIYTGQNAVSRYVNDRIASASLNAMDGLPDDVLDSSDVVAVIPDGEGGVGRYMSIYDDGSGSPVAIDVPWNELRSQMLSPNAIAYRQIPQSMQRPEYLGYGRRMKKREYTFSFGDRKFIIIGAKSARLGIWPVVMLDTAPA